MFLRSAQTLLLATMRFLPFAPSSRPYPIIIIIIITTIITSLQASIHLSQESTTTSLQISD